MSKLLEETVEIIEREGLVKNGDHIIVGLSGGPDSLCLMMLFLTMKEEWNLTLEAVHVNHQLREESYEEQGFVEDFCHKKGVPCHVFSVDCKEKAVQWKMTTEEAGRKIRYESYEAIARKKREEGILSNGIKIAVGQNRNDQGETVLFRLLRGTGVDGLAAMDFSRKNSEGTMIIRPLLGATREKIEEFCEKEGLKPCRDKTNEEAIYTRNKIRLELLPYLKTNFNANMEEALIRLSDSAREDRDYLKSQAKLAFDKALIQVDSQRVSLDRKELKKMPSAILSRVLMKGFSSIGLTKDVERKHLITCQQFIQGEKTTGSLSLPQGYTLDLVYDKVEIETPRKQETGRYRWKKREMLYEPTMLKKGEAFFDLDLLEKEHPGGKIEVRNRKPGDYLTLKMGRKKIQDLFVDMKIPVKERENLPIVAIGKEILWVPWGESMGKFSWKYKVTEETKRVVILEVDT